MASIGSPSSIASSPLRVPASGYFDGEDGEWSTFNISVGDPPQKFRVLPSAATGEVIVPGPEGCSPSDGPDCGSSRGVYQNTTGFWANESSTWSHLGLYSLGLMSDLGYETNASFGLDQVSIGESPQPRLLADQVIAGIASKEFDLGLLGLSPGPASFGDSKQPQKSLLSTLRDGGGIPSLSFGYTAGAFYQNPRIDADLILGGYDESRLEHNTITFPFDINTTTPISLSIQRISATGSLNGTISLLEDETKVRLDFTVPHLWLPRDMCDRFQTAFGLDYDNTTELYLVPENTRLELVARNPTIIFSFGASADPAQRVNVALPYNAFDLQVLHPLYPERLNYFPIRRAVNESQYTLGRAFFQEAYIIVDYGRANFSIHQAVFPAANESSRVITITEPPPASSDTPREPSNSFSAGAIAGVVIGAVALLALAAAATFFIARRRKQIKSPQAIDDLNPPETKDMSNFAELAGSDKHAPEILSRELNEMYEPQERELYGTSRSELAGRSRSELAGSLLRVELPAETHQRPQELEGDSPPGGDRLDDRRS